MSTARATLAAEHRELTGKKVARLRHAGRLPAVVYGHGIDSDSVSVDAHEFEQLRRHTGPNALVDLSIDGKKARPVLVSAVQVHPVNRRTLHVDLFLVRMTEELTVDVPLVAIGDAPAVSNLGGTLLHPSESVRVRALPDHLPQSIEYPVEALVAAMGFDVVYLPPIHPIGRLSARAPTTLSTRGPTTPARRGPSAPPTGGHDAVHPDLGTLEDFRAFVRGCPAPNGLEVALDLALQASPDHPWVTEHPEWFTTRPDGSIAYAENPPKKYQDIYPINFDTDPEGIRAEVLRIVRHWIDAGRADLPRRQPAHQAAGVLGVAARRRSTASTRMSSSSPRRSPARR